MSFLEREEVRSTFYITESGIAGALRAQVLTILRRPLSWARALLTAAIMAGPHPLRVFRHLLYFGEAIIFADWMRRERLSHFHTHFSSTVGLIASRGFSLTMSVTLHGPAEFEEPRAFNLARKVEGAMFVCTISDFGRSQVMLRTPYEQWNKIEVAPLGVDYSLFIPRSARIAQGSFEIVCVGRLAPVKGQRVLIAAVARLVDRGYPVVLRLVGDGPDRAALEAQAVAVGIGANVIFEGFQTEQRVIQILEKADLFALASFAEGVPVVLMEAMAMEIPCVATHVGGVSELIRDGIDGVLVAASDTDGLAGALALLMDDAELRDRIGHAARRRVQERYDLQKSVDRLVEIFSRRLQSTAG
jgi:glycosyltransferase involved in cell wall biosynthesis